MGGRGGGKDEGKGTSGVELKMDKVSRGGMVGEGNHEENISVAGQVMAPNGAHGVGFGKNCTAP